MSAGQRGPLNQTFSSDLIREVRATVCVITIDI